LLLFALSENTRKCDGLCFFTILVAKPRNACYTNPLPVIRETKCKCSLPYEWDDDIISEIIFQWDNEIINYPINETNIRLWKHQLVTGENLLDDYNQWNIHINRQKKICEKYQSKWNPINKKLMIGIGGSDLNADPIHGLRQPKEKGTTGWFIWTGEYSESDNFFKQIRAEQLLQIRPDLIKYFGLDVGYQFLIDKNGYEDVWLNEKQN